MFPETYKPPGLFLPATYNKVMDIKIFPFHPKKINSTNVTKSNKRQWS